MGKLNQVIAVANGKKTRAQAALTQLHHGWHPEALKGISRTYRPKADDGDPLPDERKSVHVCVDDRVRETLSALTEFFDIVATQETGNTTAAGDIVVEGVEILGRVPVGVLLFLEKQVTDLRTLATKLPTLPEDREWKWDANRGCYATDPTERVKTAKVPTPLVAYEATKEHPAQVQIVNVDEVVGYWTQVDFSGAVPVQDKQELIRRIEKFHDAIKQAREQANSLEVEQIRIGGTVLNHLFGDFLSRRAQSKA